MHNACWDSTLFLPRLICNMTCLTMFVRRSLTRQIRKSCFFSFLPLFHPSRPLQSSTHCKVTCARASLRGNPAEKLGGSFIAMSIFQEICLTHICCGAAYMERNEEKEMKKNNEADVEKFRGAYGRELEPIERGQWSLRIRVEWPMITVLRLVFARFLPRFLETPDAPSRRSTYIYTTPVLRMSTELILLLKWFCPLVVKKN